MAKENERDPYVELLSALEQAERFCVPLAALIGTYYTALLSENIPGALACQLVVLFQKSMFPGKSE